MSRRNALSLVAIAIAIALVGAAYYLGWPMGRSGGEADQPSFQVIVIKPGNFFAEEAQEAAEAGGKVPPQAIDFTADAYMLPLADVQKNAVGKAFLGLLGKLDIDPSALAQSAVLRVRDGEAITADGGDALTDNNLGVMVIAPDIVMMFDDQRTAFLTIRTRISGLQ